MLLESPGELLTREEISRELWEDGTFVDYEHGVNSAVNRIREALGDSASNPRFIETLARRGYRFVAPVERIALEGEPVLAASPVSNDPPTEAERATMPDPLSSPEIALRSTPGVALPDHILSTPQELPKAPHSLVQTLFVLLQMMYLAFYIGALANLAEIEDLFAALPRPMLALIVLIVTGVILIPIRAFVLSAAIFRAPHARSKILKLWPFVLPLDLLWALSPFLLLHHMNFGLALGCTALLVYSPFAQRSLVLMGAGGAESSAH